MENFCEVAAGALAEAGAGAGHRLSKKVRAKDIISPLSLRRSVPTA